jgi:antagonist of KipI
MTLTGGTFRFPQGATIALAGSDFGAGLPLWTACELPPGSTLRCGASLAGARCYLCVRGGIEVELFLGSASTHVLSGLGGRVVRKGDIFRIGPEPRARIRQVNPPALRKLTPRKVLRATDGPQRDWFAQLFYGSAYRVSEEANRMGLRLEGPALEMKNAGHMITEGVSLGAIQVAAGGQPIVMFVEQQTTGGYPKIVNVISADLASLGQLRPRDEIRFERVTFEEARDLIRKQEKLLMSEDLFI